MLARTDELDAANVAHLAKSISEMTGKSHGLHGIHTMLAKETSPPLSPGHFRRPPQPGILHTLHLFDSDFEHFSAATLSRTRKAITKFEIRMTGMRLAQADGKQWNLLQYLRDREVRRQSGEQLDTRLLEGRIRDSPKASSFGGNDSLGEGRTRGRKRHSSPAQTIPRGHIRQQGSRHHADRFRTSRSGLEYWSITPEEFFANITWQQANPHRMVNRRNELIKPYPDEEQRSDGGASIKSSFEYERKVHNRYSSDGGPLSPQLSLGSPLAMTLSSKAPPRNIPSFAGSSTSLVCSRSPSPVRGSNKQIRPTSDLLDIPQRVRRKLRDKIKGDKSEVSGGADSPNRSDTTPAHPAASDIDLLPALRSFPVNMRLDMTVLPRQQARPYRPKNSNSPSQQTVTRRDLKRTRARLASAGITARALLKDHCNTSIARCQTLLGTLSSLNRSIMTSFEYDFPKTIADLTTTLSNLESRQTQVANQVQFALTKTRTQTAVKIADIAAEQTSTLLLQVKAVEDKMDALEYRTKSGWTHEKTLNLAFLVLEYIVLVVLLHLWALISVLRLAKQIVWGVWIVACGIVAGIVQFMEWLFFMYP